MKVLLAAVAIATSACAIAPRLPVTAVVLITLDTTRADRLSPYGFGSAPMPALDRLAREGVVFDQATTVAPLTLPAHASLFTGLLPPRHGVRDNAGAPLSEEQVTLAEILAARGYRTAAFVGSAILDPDRGLRQGFEEYRSVPRNPDDRFSNLGRVVHRSASAVLDDALLWLADVNDSPFFLWTHLYDPHHPYEAPEPFASRHDPYVAEIAYADSQIARLLDALDHRGVLDRALVIVTADHGESLGDHREMDHGIFLYEGVTHIPLIIRASGVAPRRIADIVRITDIMPTILDLLGLPQPAVDGVSLGGLMRGLSEPEREAYAESLYPQTHGWAPLFALRRDRFKFIDAPQPELYDLWLDPFEERNVFDHRRKLATVLQACLRIQAQRGLWTVAGAPVDSELDARLAALGYVSRPPPEIRERNTLLPDPKECNGVFESGRCK